MIVLSLAFAVLTAVAPQEGKFRGRVVIHEPGAYPGYTLLAPLSSRETLLIDMQGEIVHTWSSRYPAAGSIYLLADGSILRAGRVRGSAIRAGGKGGALERISKEGEVLWSYELAGDDLHLHHDIEPLPNGNLLALAWERIPFDEAVAAGRDPQRVRPDGLLSEVLLELEPLPPQGARVVWKWRAWDHLAQPQAGGGSAIGTHATRRIDVHADLRARGREVIRPEDRQAMEEEERQMRALGYVGDEDEEVPRDRFGREIRFRKNLPPGDWLHINSVDHHPGHDLLVLSVRHLSEVWVIDHSTTTEEAASSEGGRFGRGGDLLYRWGNPRTHSAGSVGTRHLFAQHDARWISHGDGSLGLSVFNNGVRRSEGDWSSVDELALPFDPRLGFTRDGPAFGPEAPTWTYSDPEPARFYSAFLSSAERLPNGNTLICSGTQRRVFEVTSEGETVWSYEGESSPTTVDRRTPDQGQDAAGLFRATRIFEAPWLKH